MTCALFWRVRRCAICVELDAVSTTANVVPSTVKYVPFNIKGLGMKRGGDFDF